MATNKRMRGIAIHRSILIGSTATPLSAVERITSPPDHTHKWTVAVRSAASHPLPTINDAESSTSALPPTSVSAREDSSTPAVTTTASQTPSGVSTRGREHETDYHKMVGGKDDISHFIKRVQFKLHETYPQSTRNIDRPPFQVTETGWGEFDIMIRIIFVAESGEKPLTVYHRLKLHPWHPVTLRAPEAGPSIAAEPAPIEQQTQPEEASAQMQNDAEGEASLQMESNPQAEKPSFISAAQTTSDQTDAGGGAIKHPPVVHSWLYDEIVFPEPTEAFYEILLANPPTPLPTQSAQAYSDPSAHQRYKEALAHLDESSGPEGRDLVRDSGVKPPHPLHSSSGALFDALSQEAIQAEAERFDKARYNAVYQLEETRTQLIDCERRLREGRVASSRPVAS